MRRRNEPVRLTRIYTRGGDAGETSLGDGSRVSKLDACIGAYGAVDELNSQLGLVLTADVPEELREPLERIQNELFDVGADLAVPVEVEGRLRVTQERIDELERLCDHFNEPLPELKSFVLPGGTETAARLHVARAVCRRAERETLRASEETGVNPLALAYLNRLADLLFILARAANAAASASEPLWRPGA
jgi:cob(I)alamin adenosyltransferase